MRVREHHINYEFVKLVEWLFFHKSTCMCLRHTKNTPESQNVFFVVPLQALRDVVSVYGGDGLMARLNGLSDLLEP